MANHNALSLISGNVKKYNNIKMLTNIFCGNQRGGAL